MLPRRGGRKWKSELNRGVTQLPRGRPVSLTGAPFLHPAGRVGTVLKGLPRWEASWGHKPAICLMSLLSALEKPAPGQMERRMVGVEGLNEGRGLEPGLLDSGLLEGWAGLRMRVIAKEGLWD